MGEPDGLVLFPSKKSRTWMIRSCSLLEPDEIIPHKEHFFVLRAVRVKTRDWNAGSGLGWTQLGYVSRDDWNFFDDVDACSLLETLLNFQKTVLCMECRRTNTTTYLDIKTDVMSTVISLLAISLYEGEEHTWRFEWLSWKKSAWSQMARRVSSS